MTTVLFKETFESRDIFSKAKTSLKRGDYQHASALLHEALKISPENPEYLSHLGLCIGIQGNLIAGVQMCSKAIKMSPNIPILHVNLGRLLLEQGQRKEARESLMRAYKLDNTNAPAALELSRMGVRRKPVLPFLKRNHPLNIYCGKLRHWINELRRPDIKKL